jgi:hypothetical protein
MCTSVVLVTVSQLPSTYFWSKNLMESQPQTAEEFRERGDRRMSRDNHTGVVPYCE